MPDASGFITGGDIITADSRKNPDSSLATNLVKLVRDGSQRIDYIVYDSDEPYNSTVSRRFDVSHNGNVPANFIGLVAVTGPNSGVTSSAVYEGVYLGYDFTVTPIISHPTNQVPYLLTWREHLAKAAENLKNTPWGAHFHMRENVIPFDPESVGLTADQSERIRNVIYMFRTLIGAAWQEIDSWATPIPPAATWESSVLALNTMVENICDVVGVRGCVEDAVEKHDIHAWRSRRLVSPYGAFYPNKDTTPWGVGNQIAQTHDEQLGNIDHFAAALDYYNTHKGTEPDLHTIAVNRRIAELTA